MSERAEEQSAQDLSIAREMLGRMGIDVDAEDSGTSETSPSKGDASREDTGIDAEDESQDSAAKDEGGGDDWKTRYRNLEKLSGKHGQELGTLRKTNEELARQNRELSELIVKFARPDGKDDGKAEIERITELANTDPGQALLEAARLANRGQLDPLLAEIKKLNAEVRQLRISSAYPDASKHETRALEIASETGFSESELRGDDRLYRVFLERARSESSTGTSTTEDRRTNHGLDPRAASSRARSRDADERETRMDTDSEVKAEMLERIFRRNPRLLDSA